MGFFISFGWAWNLYFRKDSMPYIKKCDRIRLDANSKSHAVNPGELNYQITQLLIQYVKTKGLSYQTCNDIVGALENAKHEFQRRVQDCYENSKIEENSDVY